MPFFYIIFAFIFIAGWIDLFKSMSPFRKYLAWIVVLLLSILASFRLAGVGNDDVAYLDIFTLIGTIPDNKSLLATYSYAEYNIEIGFYFILAAISILGTSKILLFAPIAFFSVYLNMKTLLKVSPYVGASAIIYFTHFFLAKDMNAIRVGLASSIVFFATYKFFCKKYIFSTLLILISTSIHITSIFIVIPMMVYLLFLRRVTYIYVGVSIVILSFFIKSDTIFYVFSSLGFFDEKLKLYLNAPMYNYSIPIYDLINVRNLLVVIAGLAYWPKKNTDQSVFSLAFCFFFCATFFRILFGDFAIIAGRGYAAISMFEYVLIPLVLISIFGRWKGYIIICIYALLTLWLNLNINTGWMGGVEYGI